MLRINLEIGTISTLKDGSCKLVCYTPELASEAMTELFELKKHGICAAVLNGAENPNKEPIDALGLPKEGESPSRRLRSALYVHWEQQYQGKYRTFEEFYSVYMEKLIDNVKDKLNP